MTNILVTGGTGFLGSHIVRILSNSNRMPILLKRSYSDVSRVRNYNFKSYNLDEIGLSDIFEQNTIDAILHVATDYGKGAESKIPLIESNVIFPLRLAELADRYGVKVFLNTDSFFTAHSYSYLNHYSLSKKYLWENIKSTFPESSTKFINMNLFHVYGPNDSDSKFIPWIVSELLRGDKKKIELSKGDQQRDFVFSEDVVSAYLTVLENYDKIDSLCTIDVGGGELCSIKKIINTIAEIISSKSSDQLPYLDFGALPQREGEITNARADLTTLTSLGWKPKISLKDGLEQLIENSLSKNK